MLARLNPADQKPLPLDGCTLPLAIKGAVDCAAVLCAPLCGQGGGGGKDDIAGLFKKPSRAGLIMVCALRHLPGSMSQYSRA